jgi:hypothetical protein
MDNFDLKKFLIENKITRNSKLLAENEMKKLSSQEQATVNDILGENYEDSLNEADLGSVIATAAMLLQQQKLGTLKDNRYGKESVSTNAENNIKSQSTEDVSTDIGTTTLECRYEIDGMHQALTQLRNLGIRR